MGLNSVAEAIKIHSARIPAPLASTAGFAGEGGIFWITIGLDLEYKALTGSISQHFQQ